jgi:uncharacterized protein (DUF885 family)
MRKLVLLLPVFFVSVSLHAAEAWIGESNRHTQPVLELLGRYNPEFASMFGLEQYDTEVIDLGPRRHERFQADLGRALRDVEAALASAKHPKVRQDLEILAKALRDERESARLNHELMLPFYNVGEIAFQGLRLLMDERNTEERRARAVERLKRYAGMAPGSTPLAELARARTAERLAVPNLTGPYVEQVRKAIANTEVFLGGLEQMFRSANLSGWEEAHGRLGEQLRDYAKWLEQDLMKHARRDNRLPEAIYADNLRNYGVEMDPRELIRRATFGFAEIRDEMQAVARQIAKERGFPSDDYRDVIRELKKDQVQGEAILPLYKDTLKALEEMIVKHDIVTLPAREAGIRLSTEAEAAASPAPHMNPPRLIGNTGEYGEFVLPLRNPNADPGALMDDFTHKAYAWSLTAHESRPGHELQFAAMVERGVSLARAIFAFNSANVEGWGLYAEAIMKEYMPLEGQLCTLQNRLLRAARAFIDPMLNLGLMKPEEAKRILMEEVVLSDPFATQEVDRYTYRAPGQATSYYYGYMNLRAMRIEAELALRDRFSEKAFHDFVLAQGLLPPAQLRKAIMEEFVAAR